MKTNIRQVACIALVALFIVLGGVLIGLKMYQWFLPQSVTVESAMYDQLFRFTVSIAGMVFLLVEGTLLYVLVRFHRRPGETGDGPAIHGNTSLEIVWTLIPAVIVTVLSLYSYDVLKTMDVAYDSVASWFCGPLTPAKALAEPVSGGDLVVDVISRQFSWEFRYPQYDNVSSTEMHVPVDEFVLLRLTSEDVIHSFWVPQFRLKKDSLPGYVNEARFEAKNEGTYPVICAELCGLGHSEMRSALVVESQEKFDAWIQSLVSQTASAQASDPVAQGRTLFARLGCGACHTSSDAATEGQLGPVLDGLGARAGSRIPGVSAEDYVKASLRTPNEFIVEGFLDAMPSFADRLDDAELNALVQYLLQQ